MSCICDICDSEISHIQNITKHKKTEKCQKIKTLLDKRDNINNYKYNLLLNENEELKNEINKLKNIIIEKDIKIKLIEEYWKKQKILKNKDYIKENIDNDTSFQIDINVNRKQLNKTKYKDVSENIIKNNIQSLKFKDSYQLDYREDDGFINITNLCKAGGKKYNDWNRLDKTKKFLDVLSVTTRIPVVELLKKEQGGNRERHTWAHPQVSINIAQWISPEFDVLVSKWVYEIMLTGKVDIKDNKTTQELDVINKENKLLKNRIKLLESKVLQKQTRETFDNSKNVIYIVTTEYKEAQGHYKIGKTQDLQKRLSTYNTSDKHEVIYYTQCSDKESMNILEKIIFKKLNKKRLEPNKEWFFSEEDGEDLINTIEECKKMLCE